MRQVKVVLYALFQGPQPHERLERPPSPKGDRGDPCQMSPATTTDDACRAGRECHSGLRPANIDININNPALLSLVLCSLLVQSLFRLDTRFA